jgi:hypothetical protein
MPGGGRHEDRHAGEVVHRPAFNGGEVSIKAVLWGKSITI